MKLLGLPTAWSLTVEETFYLSAPFVLWAIKRHLGRWFLYPLGFLAMGGLLVFIMQHIVLPYRPFVSLDFVLRYTYFGRCIEFFCGIGLALWLRRSKGATRTAWQLTAVGLAGIMLVQIGMMLYKRIRPDALGYVWA